jgi:hypothetical protein
MASLKSFIKPESKERFNFQVPMSGQKEFAQYVVFIQTREGFEVDRGNVLAELIKAWTAGDKDYQKWVSQELNARDGDGSLQARVNALLKADKDTPAAV